MYKISLDTGQSWREVSSSQFAEFLVNAYGKHWEFCLKLADSHRVTLKKDDLWMKIEKPNEAISKEQRYKNVKLMRGNKDDYQID